MSTCQKNAARETGLKELKWVIDMKVLVEWLWRKEKIKSIIVLLPVCQAAFNCVARLALGVDAPYSEED